MCKRLSRGNSIIAAVAFFVFCYSSTARAAVIWTTETVDSSGEYNSLALDNIDAPHISYVSRNNLNESSDLKYAYKSGGNWQIETIDSFDPISISSLKLDSHGNPHISYCPFIDLINPSATLKYALKVGGIWQTETLDSNNYPGYCTLAVDSSGNPHISYINAESTVSSKIQYAVKSLGNWQIETVDILSYLYVDVSMTLDSSAKPHISYSSFSNDLSYATRNGGLWQTELLEKGSQSSIALDSSGTPHISYVGPPNVSLNYISKTSSGWQKESIDNNIAGHGSTSLVMDSNDNPRISYGGQGLVLYYAIKKGGTWQIEIVDNNCYGDFPSLAVDKSGNPHISYFDSGNNNVKYASRIQTPSMRNKFYRSFFRARKTVWMGLITDSQESNLQDMNITLVGPGDSFQGVSVNQLKRVFSLGKVLYIPLIIDKGATIGQWKIVCISSLPETGQVKRIEENFAVR